MRLKRDIQLYLLKQYLSGSLGIGLALFIYINDVPAPFPWLWIICASGAGAIIIYNAVPFSKKIEHIYGQGEFVEMHVVFSRFRFNIFSKKVKLLPSASDEDKIPAIDGQLAIMPGWVKRTPPYGAVKVYGAANKEGPVVLESIQSDKEALAWTTGYGLTHRVFKQSGDGDAK